MKWCDPLDFYRIRLKLTVFSLLTKRRVWQKKKTGWEESMLPDPRRSVALVGCPLFIWKFFFFFFVVLRPKAGHGLFIHEVSRSHTTTHHSRCDSSGRVISSSQRPLPDDTQHSQQTNIHTPGGIGAHNLRRRAAADLRLRPRGHWDLHSFENHITLLSTNLKNTTAYFKVLLKAGNAFSKVSVARIASPRNNGSFLCRCGNFSSP